MLLKRESLAPDVLCAISVEMFCAGCFDELGYQVYDAGDHHLGTSAVQFSTTLIGTEMISPTVFATRNFWPSAVTANCP